MNKETPDKTQMPPRVSLEELERFLKKLQNEDALIDDHGTAIIGGRDRQPAR
jgi:hypothetical protein